MILLRAFYTRHIGDSVRVALTHRCKRIRTCSTTHMQSAGASFLRKRWMYASVVSFTARPTVLRSLVEASPQATGQLATRGYRLEHIVLGLFYSLQSARSSLVVALVSIVLTDRPTGTYRIGSQPIHACMHAIEIRKRKHPSNRIHTQTPGCMHARVVTPRPSVADACGQLLAEPPETAGAGSRAASCHTGRRFRVCTHAWRHARRGAAAM